MNDASTTGESRKSDVCLASDVRIKDSQYIFMKSPRTGTI